MTFDRRMTPARSDLAAAHLKGQVEASRFVEGQIAAIVQGHAPLRAAPSHDAGLDSELLWGEAVTVYERRDGWAWVQARTDHYVGYVPEEALGDASAPTLRVTALMTPVFAAPDLKSPLRDMLPLNAEVAALSRARDYVEIAPGRFAYYRHLAPRREHVTDFVAVAERFLGVPYVWGGKTAAGLDCSGLIQTALAAAGIAAPRDTDMMEKALGLPAARRELQRGDLVFWKGHMGVMRDADTLLHANAFHMEVFSENLDQAVARIEQSAGPVTAMRRL